MSGVAEVQSRIIELRTMISSLAPQVSSTGSAQAFSSTLSGVLGTGSTSATTGAATGEDLVDAAKAYLGVPYRWGGTDPSSGLDCSGFVQRALKDLGVDVPRVVRDQKDVGTEVPSLDQARPGDLVVFGTHHIGIYVGGGKMIDAPHTGDVVRVRDVYETPTTIRRVLPSESEVASRASSSASSASSSSLSSLSFLGADAARLGGLAGPSAGSLGADVSPAVARWGSLFTAATQRYGLPSGLLAAVAQTESSGDPSAVSSAGAQGLMQLMPSTAAGLGVNALDPAQAVDGAARLLAGHLKTFGSVDLALAAYNAGPGAVRRYDGVPPYTETQNYVRRVTGLMTGSSS